MKNIKTKILISVTLSTLFFTIVAIISYGIYYGNVQEYIVLGMTEEYPSYAKTFVSCTFFGLALSFLSIALFKHKEKKEKEKDNKISYYFLNKK